ncbi:MAG: SBBP repeat-containing protein [Bacteroidota bacterium]
MYPKFTNLLSLFLLLIAPFSLVNAQQLDWADQLSGTGHVYTYGLATDPAGDIYVSGMFAATTDFDPGPGTTNLTPSGSQDLFLAKYAATGALAWVKQIGGSALTKGNDIVLDAAGNLYLTGEFASATDFDPGAGTQSHTPSGGSDAFVLKLDAAGDFVWVYPFGSPDGDDNSLSLDLDGSGNVYAGGMYNLQQNGTSEGFVLKLSPAGAQQWLVNFGDSGLDFVSEIAVSASGETFLTGHLRGPSNLAAMPLDGGTAGDVLFAVMDPQGVFTRADLFGGTGSDRGYGIHLDAQENAFVTGYFEDQVTFIPGLPEGTITSFGSRDAFLFRAETGGALNWVRQFGGAEADGGRSVDVDASGNIYVGGTFMGLADFDPLPGSFTLQAPGNATPDAFVTKLDPMGHFIWAAGLGGGSEESLERVRCHADGDVLAIGAFAGTADFDPQAGTVNFVSAGMNDGYLVKLEDGMVNAAESLSESRMAVGPNPFSETLTVKGVQRGGTLRLYNAMGQVVLTRKIDGQNQLRIDVPTGATGMYLLEFESGNERFRKRLIRQ